jgi:hypothetical protein
MSFVEKKIYRAVNGADLKVGLLERARVAADLMVAKMKKEMEADNTVNIVRAFPLFRFEITAKIIPYASQGRDRQNVAQYAADRDIVYEADGEFFVPTDAFVFEEESPIYGKDEDPQKFRDLVNQPRIQSARTDAGEIVDVRGNTETVPQAPRLPQPEPIAEATPKQELAPVTVEAPSIAPGETEEETYQREEKNWTAPPRRDYAVDKAIKAAINIEDPQEAAAEASQLAPGRVSVVGRQGRVIPRK